MKKLKYGLFLVSLFFLAGCIDIQEDITIKKDGSGQLTVNTDMSQLLEIMQTYIGKDEMDKQLPNKMMDTTIWMKDVMDTAKDVSPTKKALVQNASIHMQLNMDKKIFKFDMHFPFKNLNDLQKLYVSMNDGSLGTNNLFKGLASAKPMDVAAPDSSAGSMPDMNQFNAIYDFQAREGFISRKLNQQKWKDLQQDQQFSQMKDAANMGVQIPYTLTIHLPKPVKKIDNALAVLSEDKKTVTIKYNITEVFDQPQKFEYTITY
jgi:hypothetical protein